MRQGECKDLTLLRTKFLSYYLHIQSQMFETAGELSAGSNTCYCPGINFNGDSFGHLDGLRNQNLLHLSAYDNTKFIKHTN